MCLLVLRCLGVKMLRVVLCLWGSGGCAAAVPVRGRGAVTVRGRGAVLLCCRVCSPALLLAPV